MFHPTSRTLVFLLSLVAASACNGSSSNSPTAPSTVSIRFTYVQAPLPPGGGPVDPAYTGCVHSNGPNHMTLRGDWGEAIKLQPDGAIFSGLLNEVPVNRQVSASLWDVNLCGQNAQRAPLVTQGLAANGVALTRTADLNGSPALLFTARASGVIEP